MLPPPIPFPPPAEYWARAKHWGVLSLSGELTSFRQTVTFDYVGDGAGGAPRWVLHRVTQPGAAARSEDWADGARCPALAGAMHALAALPGPRFSDPADDRAARGQRIKLDGVDFLLEAEGGYPVAEDGSSTRARVSIQGNDGGPLDAWFARLKTATAACWSSAPPKGAVRQP